LLSLPAKILVNKEHTSYSLLLLVSSRVNQIGMITIMSKSIIGRAA
jgi:hypothetical protein